MCPSLAKAIALVLPHSDTEGTQLHLNAIAGAIPPSRHAVIVLDRAPWHTTLKLEIPKNISLLLLPAVSPELNPVEQVWKWLREHELSNRVFKTYEDIVEASCSAWNIFASLPDVITSIASRGWANLGI